MEENERRNRRVKTLGFTESGKNPVLAEFIDGQPHALIFPPDDELEDF
jgi:hypothetical protein